MLLKLLHYSHAGASQPVWPLCHRIHADWMERLFVFLRRPRAR